MTEPSPAEHLQASGEVVPFEKPEERKARYEAELSAFEALSDSELRNRLNDWICIPMSMWPDEVKRFDAYAKRERSAAYQDLHDTYPPSPGQFFVFRSR